MNPLNPIDFLKSYSPPSDPGPTPVNQPMIDEFERYIDHMVKEKLSKPVVSQSAIAAQQRLEEFKHKLAVLTGMLEQAEIAMNNEKKLAAGSSSADEQNYFMLKSKLSQVGLPDGANNLI